MVTERTSQKRKQQAFQRGAAQRLRREQTDAERKFWWKVCNRQIGGFKFKRQYPIGPYIVDFMCIESRVIVEIDGSQHSTRRSYDRARDSYLQREGFLVIRFWNADVLTNLEGVIERVFRQLTLRSAPSP